MLNTVVLVGRLGWVNTSHNVMQLLVQGEDEVTPVEVQLTEGMVDTVNTYCKANAVLGVKGQIATNDDNEIIIKAKHISFLSSSSKTINEQVNN